MKTLIARLMLNEDDRFIGICYVYAIVGWIVMIGAVL